MKSNHGVRDNNLHKEINGTTFYWLKSHIILRQCACMVVCKVCFVWCLSAHRWTVIIT